MLDMHGRVSDGEQLTDPGIDDQNEKSERAVWKTRRIESIPISMHQTQISTSTNIHLVFGGGVVVVLLYLFALINVSF